jgi:tetratricopeptide (TPR) repeat protein
MLVPLRLAQWEYLTGRRKQALARLDQVIQGAQPALASVDAAQMSIWLLETGDAARARQYALRTAPDNPFSATCRFLTQPPASASEWTDRATRAFPEPSQARLRQSVLAYALLISKHFPEAAALWMSLYEQTPPGSPDPLEVPLAWALIETGRFDRAGELLATNAIPDGVREHPFQSLSFPRVFFLRGVLLEREGQRQEARENYDLFLRLSGDLPMIFGQEQRAREALARR